MAINKDWKTFILSILDGVYELDIEKTGSVIMFVRNQISSCQFKNLERNRFESDLKILLEDFKFTAGDFFTKAGEYQTIVDLCIGFLGSNAKFLKNSASLFFNVYNNASSLTEKGKSSKDIILNKTSYAIIKFIEEWKIKYHSLEKNPDKIYDQYSFMYNLKEWWLSILSEEKVFIYPNVLIGIVYLDEWKNIPPSNRARFFTKNKNDPNSFVAILNDMGRLNGNKLFNYFSFSDDCREYFPQFYEFIKRKTKYFYESPTVIHDKESTSEFLEMREEYKLHTKKLESFLIESDVIPYRTPL